MGGFPSTQLKNVDLVPENWLFESNITRGSDLFTENKEAHAAFIAFISAGEWTKDFNLSEFGSPGYISPNGHSLNDFQAKFSQTTTAMDLLLSEDDLKPLLVSVLFPLFLRSKEYDNWVVSKTSERSIGSEEQAERIERLNGLFNQAPSKLATGLLANTKVAAAIKTIDGSDLNNFIKSDTWIDSLIRMVENLPVSVSLSSAEVHRAGFPLIYVNKAFEEMSGYDRSEILGHNCRFLQSIHTEPDQIQLLTEALRDAKPVKVALTNVRKDGREFGNLLAMKPVFDQEGVYMYVIGVQCDISNPAVTNHTVRTVEDLLSILPNIV